MSIFAIALPLGLAWMIGGVLALKAGALPAWLQQLVRVHPWTSVLFMPPVILLPAFAVALPLGFRGRRESVAELIEAGGQLCLRCRYRLDGSRPSGACPECGTPYDPASLRRGWCRTYRELSYEIEWPRSATATPAPPP